MLGSASDEAKRFTDQDARTFQLRNRFEDDYDLYRNEKFNIPKEEGKWESYTTNRPSTDSRKLINTLASARPKIWIPLTEEDTKQRKNLSKTEQFPYGAIALRDSIYGTVPEMGILHDKMCWFATIRGWEVLYCYLYDKDDGKNGKVIPHIVTWDMLNTRWISDDEGLAWGANKRWASIAEIKKEYNQEVRPDINGGALIYDIVDREEEGIICENDYLKKKEHYCEHVPLLILPGGADPFIQSERHSDTLKSMGESFAVNNRHLYGTENRIGSYMLTLAGRAAKTPMIHKYDSTKTGGKVPDFEGSPFEKGAVVPVDIGVGEDIDKGISPELNKAAYEFFSYLQGRESVGGQAPISYGENNVSLPAAGINMLRHASMDNIKPFQQLVERSYVWLAHELVSQYKTGNFGKMEIQGMDGSQRRFKIQVSPKDIDDSWNFDCSLLIDLPQDELSNMGMAVQAHETHLLSDQRIRDRLLNVEDPDMEQEIIDRESAEAIANIKLRKVAKALEDDGDFQGAQYIHEAIAQSQQPQSQPGVASQPGIPSPVRPSADTTAVVPQPPQAGKLRTFLSRLGGGNG